MAPVFSGLSSSEEGLLRKCLLRHYPPMQVDILEASPAVKEGENFMSDVKRVDIVGHLLENGECTVLSLVMKCLPKSAERCQLFHCDIAFRNEATFYSAVLPTLLKYSIDRKLPFPHCLHAADDVMVLRHLGPDGFIMADRKKGLDVEHCQVVLKELGKFHAASLAMKYLDTEAFSKISTAVNEIYVTEENTILGACVDNCVNMALRVLTDVDSSVITYLKAIRGRGFELLAPLVTPSEPMAVICHGDLWINNLLFRYSPESPKTEIDVCFLDLQACRYASLALDILYFLFSSSRSGVTRGHFSLLIATYHTALKEHLKRLAPLAPNVSLDDIMVEIKKHSLFGLVMSLMVMPVVTAQDFTITLDDVTEESIQNLQNDVEERLITPGYKYRVQEIIEVFYIEGLL